MQDWVELLIAFVLGFFVKHLLGTVCNSRLIEGSRRIYGDTTGDNCENDNACLNGMICETGYCMSPNIEPRGAECVDHRRCKSNYCNPDTKLCDDPVMRFSS